MSSVGISVTCRPIHNDLRVSNASCVMIKMRCCYKSKDLVLPVPYLTPDREDDAYIVNKT